MQNCIEVCMQIQSPITWKILENHGKSWSHVEPMEPRGTRRICMNPYFKWS